jgi:hypothetical protein
MILIPMACWKIDCSAARSHTLDTLQAAAHLSVAML